MLFYQCFTLTVRNVETANPQRATGARGIVTISFQTRGDMVWIPGLKIPREKIFTIFCSSRVLLNTPSLTSHISSKSPLRSPLKKRPCSAAASPQVKLNSIFVLGFDCEFVILKVR